MLTKPYCKVSKEKNFDLLERYLQESEPVQINLSSLPLIEYLSSVVVSQQLSTKAAKTIWSRVHLIINTHTNYQNLETELHSAGLSKSKANYVIGLINNLNLSSLQRSDLKNYQVLNLKTYLLQIKELDPGQSRWLKCFI
jgi:3-methyladenine DNA glycosylase/8-oxoguanine DNA glycosylase